ncbi:MAG: hypothetical protein K2X61_04735 [Caulobacteraceae bacterium]|nr:hypothetical protein [Caulobacteraceae bacterium]
MATVIGVYATAALAASTGLVADARINSPVRRLAHDVYTGDLAQNDAVSLGKFDWDTILDPALSIVEFTDFGTSVTLDIGDVTYPTALCVDLDIATAAGTANPLRSVSIADRRKPLWSMLGYASLAAAKAVGARCELLASFKDANPASGTLGWTLYGSAQ